MFNEKKTISSSKKTLINSKIFIITGKNSFIKSGAKKRFNLLFKLTKSKSINELNIFFKNIINKSNLIIDFKKLKINIQKEIKSIIKETNLERLSNSPIKINERNLF